MADLELQREQARRRALGRAPLCEAVLPGVDIGRDLRLTTGPNGLDLEFVSGMDALGQALTIALTTLLGSDLFNTNFGFDGLNALVEETNPVLQRERIRVSIIRVLQSDPRVRKIVDVKLGDDRLERVSAGNRVLSVTVIFETITGERAEIDLGKAPVTL